MTCVKIASNGKDNFSVDKRALKQSSWPAFKSAYRVMVRSLKRVAPLSTQIAGPEKECPYCEGWVEPALDQHDKKDLMDVYEAICLSEDVRATAILERFFENHDIPKPFVRAA